MSISLSRETIHLMLQSQRIIKKEFGVKIELDDDQVMARVFAYAAQSSSTDLRDCAKALMQQLLPGEEEKAEESTNNHHKSAARIYRGQVIEEPKTEKVKQDVGAGAVARKNVIYRGQRVTT